MIYLLGSSGYLGQAYQKNTHIKRYPLQKIQAQGSRFHKNKDFV